MINTNAAVTTSHLDYQRFGKVLGMLVAGSDDTIKLVAVARANAILDAAGLNWGEFAALAAGSQRSAANYAVGVRPHSQRWSSSSPFTPSPVLQPAPEHDRLSGTAIPDYICGLVSVRERRTTICGKMLIVDLRSKAGTIYGPLAVFDAKLIEAFDGTFSGLFAGLVRQPSRLANLPTLSPDYR